MDAIDGFWRWFVANASELSADPDGDAVCDAISGELAKVHEGLVGELSRGPHSDPTLIISANGNRALFPFVERVFTARPAVPGWEILAFRPPATEGDLGVINMDGHELDTKLIRFVAWPVDGKLEVDVYVPGYTDEDETIGAMGFIALDHTVGEYAMETRVGGISWYPIEDAPETARPLAELVAALPKN
jgi:hypothetical protein